VLRSRLEVQTRKGRRQAPRWWRAAGGAGHAQAAAGRAQRQLPRFRSKLGRQDDPGARRRTWERVEVHADVHVDVRREPFRLPHARVRAYRSRRPPKVHFGHMTPTARPITLAAAAMAMMIGDVIIACNLEQEALLVERVKAFAANLESGMTATTTTI